MASCRPKSSSALRISRRSFFRTPTGGRPCVMPATSL